MIFALGLAFLSGYIALSYEILWFRAYSFASGSAAQAFGLLLGAYLVGIAIGSLVSGWACRGAEDSFPEVSWGALSGLIFFANVLGYLFVPAMAWLLTIDGTSWVETVPLVGIVSAGLGAIFPLISHFSVAPDETAGANVSYIYLANILGSASGSLITGFWLMDRWPLRGISLCLGLLGLAMTAIVLLRRGSRFWLRLAAVAGVGALMAILNPQLFAGLYEKLQLKSAYWPGYRFAHVVETKSGVITVDQAGIVYGGGMYDGAFNTSLDRDVNGIVRAYALAGLHPRPRQVLMIGLSSGSWATVIANHPAVEELTIVEINPGYARLIPEYAEVAELLNNPKVRIEFDDGRRWLVRNQDRRFDAIVSNTSFHWRVHTSNLLSVEFLELVRSRLRNGGIFYYNTTDSPRVQKTGVAVFPYALGIQNFLALSDRPLGFDRRLWKERLENYPRQGRRLFDPARGEDRERLERLAEGIAAGVEARESIVARSRDLIPVTDDNMGTEWSEPIFPIFH